MKKASEGAACPCSQFLPGHEVYGGRMCFSSARSPFYLSFGSRSQCTYLSRAEPISQGLTVSWVRPSAAGGELYAKIVVG